MAQSRTRQEARLKELIERAKRMNLEVRMEKLLREAGYRAHSGRCRVKGQEVILIDRDASLSEQIEYLSGELTRAQPPATQHGAPLEPATEDSGRGV